MRRFVLVLAAVVCVGAACAAPAEPSRSEAPPSATASPRADLVVGGDRPVTVHIPASYDAKRLAPLLILLHGYSTSGEEHERYFKLGPAAEARGFVYASPDGTMDRQGNRFWNATDTCCDFDDSGVDDVAYLADVIAEIQANLSIDPKRIYVLGHSNGGFMAYRLACDEADVIAAIVSLAGATYADPALCAPSTPVSVVQIHGTADDTIKYEGGTIPGSPPYPGAEATAQTWAAYDGCEEASMPLDAKVDVDAEQASGSDPAETTVAEWRGCTSGVTVQLWTIPDGDHAPSIATTFADTILAFLLDHPKPGA
ncbi:MAG TPA: alpha/beta fold hydrolase [Candidatus Limnocylindrales bacterium]|nr:alpha/beta fold hydrolase [Candidatus Limnocylindrales bacterium]